MKQVREQEINLSGFDIVMTSLALFINGQSWTNSSEICSQQPEAHKSIFQFSMFNIKIQSVNYRCWAPEQRCWSSSSGPCTSWPPSPGCPGRWPGLPSTPWESPRRPCAWPGSPSRRWRCRSSRRPTPASCRPLWLGEGKNTALCFFYKKLKILQGSFWPFCSCTH